MNAPILPPSAMPLALDRIGKPGPAASWLLSIAGRARNLNDESKTDYAEGGEG